MTYCEKCLAKKRIFERKRREKNVPIPRSERYNYGLCYTCGEPLDSDKRLCQKCCERGTLNLKHNKLDNSNHPWRYDNQILKCNAI